MNDALFLVLPLLSELVGAAITYATNVRQRRRTTVEDVFHDAIAAVAAARSSHDFIASLAPWTGATEEEHQAFNSQLSREGNLNYARAVAEARAALARASAFDPWLAPFSGHQTGGGSEAVHTHADEIMAALPTQHRRAPTEPVEAVRPRRGCSGSSGYPSVCRMCLSADASPDEAAQPLLRHDPVVDPTRGHGAGRRRG